jgi:hypothetical protein
MHWWEQETVVPSEPTDPQSGHDADGEARSGRDLRPVDPPRAHT